MKTKTAAIILNHNLPDYTDLLYESLKPYERDDYDLMVFDNGSTPEGRSKYTTYASETNGYFGGGFNAAMEIVLADEKYDSMLFLNNDLTVFGMNFVKSLRESMFHKSIYPQTLELEYTHSIENHVVSNPINNRIGKLCGTGDKNFLVKFHL
jgi:hypothetical protein